MPQQFKTVLRHSSTMGKQRAKEEKAEKKQKEKKSTLVSNFAPVQSTVFPLDHPCISLHVTASFLYVPSCASTKHTCFQVTFLHIPPLQCSVPFYSTPIFVYQHHPYMYFIYDFLCIPSFALQCSCSFLYIPAVSLHGHTCCCILVALKASCLACTSCPLGNKALGPLLPLFPPHCSLS